MTAYDSADMLSRLIERLRLPVDDTGAVISQEAGWGSSTTAYKTSLYRLLTEAEAQIVQYLAPRIPHWFITAPLLLTSSDGGYTYPIKDNNGTQIYAVGVMRLYVRLADIPHSPLVEGIDYTLEGNLIRMPANRTWTFSDGPYVQPTNETVALSDSVNPTIPIRCRDAMVAYAAAEFCAQGGMRDPALHQQKFAGEMSAICLEARTAMGPSNHQTFGLPLTKRGLMAGII